MHTNPHTTRTSPNEKRWKCHLLSAPQKWMEHIYICEWKRFVNSSYSKYNSEYFAGPNPYVSQLFVCLRCGLCRWSPCDSSISVRIPTECLQIQKPEYRRPRAALHCSAIRIVIFIHVYVCFNTAKTRTERCKVCVGRGNTGGLTFSYSILRSSPPQIRTPLTSLTCCLPLFVCVCKAILS
jgi:hypothetical protein